MGDAQIVVAGYVQLFDTLVASWGKLASKVAGQVDAGSLTAKDATSDVAEAGALGVQSWVLIANEALDAAAVLGGTQHDPVITPAQEFTAPAFKPGVPPVVRTLELAGPLTHDLGDDSIDAIHVTITPKLLLANEFDFKIQVDATGHAAGGYRGTVNLIDPAGAPVGSVAVFVLV
jgi:hypothetical protein